VFCQLSKTGTQSTNSRQAVGGKERDASCTPGLESVVSHRLPETEDTSPLALPTALEVDAVVTSEFVKKLVNFNL
jgi:hypothetical protein